MSRRAIGTESHLIIVGWDDGLQKFFGQVWTPPEGDGGDGPPELWVGVSWGELPTVEHLCEALGHHATIPEDVIEQLEDDYRNRRPLAPGRRDPGAGLLFTGPKNTD
jgi:hypothetical protein